MSHEDQLKTALHEDAASHEVDLHRLYASTRERLDGRAHLARRRHITAPRVLLAAAAVVVVAGVGLAAPKLTDQLFADEAAPSSDLIDDAFTCPVKRTTDFPSSDDDAFLPELTADARPAGEAEGAPLHDVLIDGDQAILRLGNEDGTLASASTFERVDGDYRRLAVTKCTNDPAADSSPVPLVAEGLETTAPGLRAGDVAPGAMLVADRLTYDVTGLEKRITVYAYPCERRLCLEAGSDPANRLVSSLPGSGAPADRTSLLADPDDMVGIEPAELLVGLYDPAGELAGVSWTDKAGARTEVTAVAGDEWTGRLFLALAPAATFAALDVEDVDATSRSYAAGDLRG